MHLQKPTPTFHQSPLDGKPSNPVCHKPKSTIRYRKRINMPNQTLRILGLFVFLLSMGPAELVRADGWTWGPFSKSSSSRDSSPLYSKSSSGTKSWLPTLPTMKMPKMPWSNSGPKVNSYSRNNTSTWGKMTKTSKRWWNKTTELLDPYPDPKPSTYTTSDSQPPKPSFWSGWFGSKEPEGPRTANDFLAQPTIK